MWIFSKFLGCPYRVIQAHQESNLIVDVDGSYLYKKYRSLADAGNHVSLPSAPMPPISGWKVVTDNTYKEIVPTIHAVTSGKFINI